MGQEGAPAPNNAVHGHAAALELGAHGAVHDDDLAVLKPSFQAGSPLRLPLIPSRSGRKDLRSEAIIPLTLGQGNQSAATLPMSGSPSNLPKVTRSGKPI